MDVLRPTAIHLPAWRTPAFFFFCFFFPSVHERGVGGSELQRASQKHTVFLSLLGSTAAADELLKGTYRRYF